jgi:16S rRNA G1207 methylase RsmC
VSSEHYFSANPSAEQKLTNVEFSVADQLFNLQAAAGTFSSGRLDKGTTVLLSLTDELPQEGRILDLGCGWGPIGIAIAKLASASQVWGVDVNARSVALANQNAKKLQLTNFQAVLSENLPSDLRFDEIWSNPPIRIGKKALHELLTKYLAVLTDQGRALLVVQKQLGAESLLKWLAAQYPAKRVSRVLTDRGYWVIELASSSTFQ